MSTINYQFIRDSQIAGEIIKQLGGVNYLHLMIGAKNFGFANDNGKVYAQFSYPKSNKNHSNKVKILYDMKNDTYIMEFWNITKCIKVSSHADLYFDQMADVFEMETDYLL